MKIPENGKLLLNVGCGQTRPKGWINTDCLYQLAKRYVAGFEAGKPEASREFLWALNLHLANTCPENGSRLKKFSHWLQGFLHQHKYMYDLMSLKANLARHSFRDLKECVYGVSNYLGEITEVEGPHEGVPAIYVEAKK